jgi:hypothetical protein
MIELINEYVQALYTVLKDNPQMLRPFFLSELNLDTYLHRGPSKAGSFGKILHQLSKLTREEKESLGIEFTVEIVPQKGGALWLVKPVEATEYKLDGILDDVMTAWEKEHGDKFLAVHDLQPDSPLGQLLTDTVQKDDWSPKSVGRWLNRYKDQTKNGKTFRITSRKGGYITWQLEGAQRPK